MAKKFYTRALSVGLSLALCAGLVAPSFAASFQDLNDAIGGGDADENSFTAEDGSTRYGYGAKNEETGKYEIEAWNGTRNVLDSEGRETGETADTRHVRLNGEVKRQDNESKRTTTITIENGADVTLDLNGNNVDANQSENSVITIKQGGELTLTDSAAQTVTDEEGNEEYQSGAVTGGSGAGNRYRTVTYGGGVYNQGTFTMNGGAISGNTAHIEGCGVYNEGTFTMNGGEISGNTDSESGRTSGNCVCNLYGTFTLNGGAITGNTSSGVFNGRSGALFTMNGGEISGNTTGGYGGGVTNFYGGAFTMNGGKISGNTSLHYGGVDNEGTFTMNGGAITNNTATAYTGGVGSSTYGGFTMNGGEISGNTAGEGCDDIRLSLVGRFNLPEDSLWELDSWECRNGFVPVQVVYSGTELNSMFGSDRGMDLKYHVHKFTEEQITKQPTCTEKGEMVGSGCYCGQPTVTVEIAPLGHDMQPSVAAKDATCEGAGNTAGTKCSRCDHTEGNEPIDPLKHDLKDDWAVTKQPAVGVKGEETRECQREGCTYKETRPVPALQPNPTVTIEDPETPLAGLFTRADAIGYLWQQAGEPDAELSTFEDVPEDHQWAVAIGWAQDMGIAAADEDGNFRPDDLVLRWTEDLELDPEGELQEFLNRYALFAGIEPDAGELFIELGGEADEVVMGEDAQVIFDEFFAKLEAALAAREDEAA